MLSFASGQLLVEMIRDDEFIPILAIALGCFVAVVAIISVTIGKVVVSRHREQTKRELAAYVAEGTLEPDKAVAMINAGRPRWSCCGRSEMTGKQV